MAIRSLVDRIEVRAGAKRGLTDVTLVGTLATILALGTNENARSTDATGGAFFLVAGGGNGQARTNQEITMSV